MNLTALPAFSDNPLKRWVNGTRVLGVEPGDAASVGTALEARGLHRSGILVTPPS